MAGLEYFEARRYSAVILRDGRLQKAEDLFRAWHFVAPATTDQEVGRWRVRRFTFTGRRNYYPPKVSVPPSLDGHPHEVYAISEEASNQANRLIVAAPYVKLLIESMGSLDRGLEGDAPLTFAKPDMGELFDHFERSHHRFLSASRIEVRMRQSGLEKVALSGKNPLRSDLRQALQSVSSPYSIRVRSMAVDGIRPTNVNLDVHGNLWWHLSNDRAWGNVTELLALLFDDFALADTADVPPKKLVRATSGSVIA